MTTTKIYTTPQDTTVECTYFTSGGAATFNYGATTYMGTGLTSKGLLRFDLSSIPVAAICVSAILSLWSQSSQTTKNFLIYAILAANAGWVEGTESGAAQVGSSCQSKKIYDTVSWAGSAGLGTADTDYDSVELGTIASPNNSLNTEATVALTAAKVQNWFGQVPGSAGNPGMVITGTTARTWHSDNSLTAGYIPKLVVTYTVEDVEGVIAHLRLRLRSLK